MEIAAQTPSSRRGIPTGARCRRLTARTVAPTAFDDEVRPRLRGEELRLRERKAREDQQRTDDLDERAHDDLRCAVLRPVTARPSPGRAVPSRINASNHLMPSPDSRRRRALPTRQDRRRAWPMLSKNGYRRVRTLDA